MRTGSVGGAALSWFGSEHSKVYDEAPDGWAYWTSVAACAGLIMVGTLTRWVRTGSRVAPMEKIPTDDDAV